MLLNPFSYHQPKTLNEASDLLTSLPDAKLIAGGTFVINTLKTLKKRGLKTPAHLISLKKIKELKGIRVDHHSISIGAMTTCAKILSSQELAQSCPVLVAIAQNIATTQIRIMATIGGNIASRHTWTEFNTGLLALDAKLHFGLPDKKKTTVAIDDFLSKNAKCAGILTAVSIEPKEKTIAVYRRIPKCSDVDIPLLTVCLSAHTQENALTDVHVVIGCATFFPKREKKCEQILEGDRKSVV